MGEFVLHQQYSRETLNNIHWFASNAALWYKCKISFTFKCVSCWYDWLLFCCLCLLVGFIVLWYWWRLIWDPSWRMSPVRVSSRKVDSTILIILLILMMRWVYALTLINFANEHSYDKCVWITCLITNFQRSRC